MNLKLLISLFSLYSLSCRALDLQSIMTQEEQKKTGFASLTKKEKKELNLWLTKNVTLIKKNPEKEFLSLNINIQNGRELILSDGSKWEVAPEDQKISSIWLTPIPLKLVTSDSQEYPHLLINLDSEKEQVKVRQAV